MEDLVLTILTAPSEPDCMERLDHVCIIEVMTPDHRLRWFTWVSKPKAVPVQAAVPQLSVSLHIHFTAMLFPPARKCKSFCSNPSCLVQCNLLSFLWDGLCSPRVDAKCQPQSSQVPNCTSASSLQWTGAPLNLRVSLPATVCDAGN